MNIEILAPAGNMEKLKTAFNYGADACYFAGTKLGLRAYAGNFNDEELKQSVEYAHSLGKKAYITINVIAHNPDFAELKDYILYLHSINVDAVICADIGIIKFIRDVCPSMNIHVSTQANITNKYSAKFFCDLGVTRIILARELSLTEIKEIRDFIPANIEIETFVHGAMCISYSGRCLLSNYFTGRDSNHGECVQACRWNYALCEKSRQGEYFDITEDERGTYILNSKDLCMIEHLDKLVEAGITSFKIEGRMKSPYYVATVVNAYKRAFNVLQNCYKNGTDYVCPKELILELENTSHRRYTTGFFLGANNKEYIENSMPIQSSIFIAYVLADADGGKVLVEQRNRFKVGDVLEVLSPNNTFGEKITITKVETEKGEEVVDASRVQEKLYIYTNVNLKQGDILRR